MGQHTDPDGIYFGGQELQPETRVMMNVYREAFDGYKQILHLDLHTGYGPREQMTLVTSPREPLSSRAIAEKYALPQVAGANPDEFYTIQGDMLDWEYALVQAEFPGARIFAAAFEFGTFGDSLWAGIRSLRIVVFRNQLYQVGAKNQATAEWVEKESREHLCPSDPQWLKKVVIDARRAYENILRTQGLL